MGHGSCVMRHTVLLAPDLTCGFLTCHVVERECQYSKNIAVAVSLDLRHIARAPTRAQAKGVSGTLHGPRRVHRLKASPRATPTWPKMEAVLRARVGASGMVSAASSCALACSAPAAFAAFGANLLFPHKWLSQVSIGVLRVHCMVLTTSKTGEAGHTHIIGALAVPQRTEGIIRGGKKKLKNNNKNQRQRDRGHTSMPWHTCSCPAVSASPHRTWRQLPSLCCPQPSWRGRAVCSACVCVVCV